MNCTKEMAVKMLEAVNRIYLEKPWDIFESHEVFELIQFNNGVSKVYCVFQVVQNKKAITLFTGQENFTDLSNLFKLSGIAQVDIFHYFERETFEILFDQPDQLDDEFLKLGEELGYTARELPLIYFCEKRCLPDFPNEQEALFLVEILSGLKDAMDAYFSEKVELDFNKRRFVYDLKKKTCSSKKTGYRPRKYDVVEIDHPELMEELLNLHETEEVWEYDLQPTMVSMRRTEDLRPMPMYLAALADPNSGQVLSAVPLENSKDFQFECIDLLIEALLQRGIPKVLTVRHPLVGGAVMDLCQRLEIEMIPVHHFEVLDDFYDGVLDFFEEKIERC